MRIYQSYMNYKGDSLNNNNKFSISNMHKIKKTNDIL